MGRNIKYLNLDVDWTATYFYFNDEEKNTDTSFNASRTKAKKLHVLIKELPTREQMKLSNPILFEDWKCPCCLLHDETFAHIWSCYENIPKIRTLFNDNLRILQDIVASSCKDLKMTNTFDINRIKQFDFFSNFLYSDSQFTFIDLIKGIVPEQFSDYIFSIFNNVPITHSVISLFLHNVFLDYYENIWKPRCDLAKRQEQLAGITIKDIKKHNRDNINIGNSRVPRLSSSLDIDSILKDRILNHVRFGNSLGLD